MSIGTSLLLVFLFFVVAILGVVCGFVLGYEYCGRDTESKGEDDD